MLVEYEERMSASHNLFVCGTLRHGADIEIARRLRASADWLGHATSRGRLYMIKDYPGFVPSEDAEWVDGDVYRLRSPERILPELDQYEGCGPGDPEPHEYRRAVIAARLDSGDWVSAEAYLYTRDTIGLDRIQSGDWNRARPA
jgi:gamma-glutamylcyclotransferase (GGCT)/AIG2-like uncharacterized protein YtfP